MQDPITLHNRPVKGNIFTIDTGSTSSKFAYYKDGVLACEGNVDHPKEEIAKVPYFADQLPMRHDAALKFLLDNKVPCEEVDVIMARGGLFTPVITGIYDVNADMREVLMSGRDGKHACNLSAVMAEDLAEEVNEARAAKGVEGPFGPCRAYVADPPMADEMLPECRLGGIPEFRRETLFHALNSRAIVRRYLTEIGHETNDITAIVCHMGGGVTISLHHKGRVIDTSHGLGGDGPITPERAGCCPPLQLVDMCFSGKYTADEIRHKLVGGGGAVAYFGTNDMRVIQERALAGIPEYKVFMDAFILNIAKYIAAETADVCGKVDVLIFTGGVAHSKYVTDEITRRVGHLFPDIRIYPGEDELRSLAENGYIVLSGKAKVHTYDKDRLIED